MAELSRSTELSLQTFCEMLSTFNTKTAFHRKILFNHEPGMPQEEESVFNHFIEREIEENGTQLTLAEFKNLPPVEQTAEIKRGIEAVRKQLLEPFPPQIQNTSWEDMCTKGYKIWETDNMKLVPQYFEEELIKDLQASFGVTSFAVLVKK